MTLKDSLRLPWGAQWLGPGASTAGARVPSLLGELLIRSCKPGGKRKEKLFTAFSNCVCDLKKGTCTWQYLNMITINAENGISSLFCIFAIVNMFLDQILLKEKMLDL